MCHRLWGMCCRCRFRLPLFLIWIPLGLLSLRRVLSFPHYRALNQALLSQVASQMDAMKKAAKTASEKTISADTSITSRKEGFAYLNELFIKRHRKILWRSTLRDCRRLCRAGMRRPAAYDDPARR